MLNTIGKGIVGLIVVGVIAFILGVRIHPEALGGGSGSALSGLEKVQLTNGKVLVGRMVSESSAGLLLDISGVQMTLTSSEIASRGPLTEADRASGNYSEWLTNSSSSNQFITYRESDNLILQRLTGKKKKPVVAAGTNAWGARTKDYKLPSEQTKEAPKGSMMDMYQKSMSKENLEQWKNESIAALNGPGRNPIMEAFKYGKKDENKS